METPDTAPPTADDLTYPPPTDEPVAAPGPSTGLVVLGIVAAIVVAAAVVPLWAFACTLIERRLPVAGVGLAAAVAWVLRRVSRRANPVLGVVAALIAAVGCLVGSVIADFAIVAVTNKVGFWDLVDTRLTGSTWFESLKASNNGLTWGISVFALYVAYAIAGAWPKPKPVPAAAEAEGADLDSTEDADPYAEDGADDPDAERDRDA